MNQRLATFLMVSGWILAAVVCHATQAPDPVSFAVPGWLASGAASRPWVSSDGQSVAFVSTATDLVVIDANAHADVFVRHMTQDAALLVSVGLDGAPANGASDRPSMSENGRLIVFQSDASNLVVGDVNGLTDVFVHDRRFGETLAVSALHGAPIGGFHPAISADGRFVAFASDSTTLVPGDLNGATDVFVADLETGAIVLASVDPSGGQAHGPSGAPVLSANGESLAFESLAANLVPGDANGMRDVFVRDLAAERTERVSVAVGAAEANGPSMQPSLSDDGRFVAFASDASNLVETDANNRRDVFLRDRIAGTTILASRATGGGAPDGASESPVIWPTGHGVAYVSEGSNITPGNTNGCKDVFIFLPDLGQTKRVSLGPGGLEPSFGSVTPAISRNLEVVAFVTEASNLPMLGLLSGPDVFLRHLTTETTKKLNGRLGALADGSSLFTALSSNGRFVAFDSEALNVFTHPRGTVVIQEVYVRDMDTGELSFVPGLPGPSTNFSPALSADGSVVAMTSWPVSGRPSQVLARSLVSGAYAVVSSCAGGTVGNGFSLYPKLTPDGRYAAFISTSSNLVPGDTNTRQDAFLKDLQSGMIVRLSVSSGGVQGNELSAPPSISADGRFAAFASTATNLVPGDVNGVPDIFVRDTFTQTTERISVAYDGGPSNATSYGTAINADGRYVAFVSQATNLVPDDTNGVADIFVRDRWNETTRRVSVASDRTEGDQHSFGPMISADGRLVGFSSDATTLVRWDANGVTDAFVHDQDAADTRRVSTGAYGLEANGTSILGSLSADGQYASFQSAANNLVPRAKTPGVQDAFRVRVRAQASSFVFGTICFGGMQGRPVVTVTLIPDSGPPVVIEHVETGPNGEFGVSAPLLGRFRVGVKGPTHLREDSALVLDSALGPTSLGVIELVNGDLNSDDVVNIDDYLILAAHYGEPGPEGDLNGDGWVDLDDYLILAENFGRASA